MLFIYGLKHFQIRGQMFAALARAAVCSWASHRRFVDAGLEFTSLECAENPIAASWSDYD